MSATGPETTTRPQKGEQLDLRVHALAFGGNGIARHGGWVVFVPGTVPGDRVRAVLTKRKRGYGEARLLDVERDSSMVELTLHSGRNRIVRRMLDAVGHPVVELVRRSFGPLNLGTLRSGGVRDLTKVEVGQLLTLSRDTERPAGKPEE